MSNIADQEYLLSQQYQDATNLNARIQIHVRFSTNPYGLLRWLFDQLTLPPRCTILELGCGPGSFWQQNAERIPPGWSVTLSDFSPGMIRAAQDTLREIPHAFRYEVIDAQAIPYPDENFDAVIANHMLYHVPDRPQAYAEIRRVLRRGGQLYAATAGEQHLREIKELARRFDLALASWGGHPASSFLLETGAAELDGWFDEVTLARYPDALVVTEAEPIVAFILSAVEPSLITPERRSALLPFVEQELAQNGPLHVTKDSGTFIARR